MSDKTDSRSFSIEDLEPKMRLEGTVTQVGLHGAVVDIGLPCEGLLHISQLSDNGEVDAVSEAVSVGDDVVVWVTEIEPEQNRVSLTMIKPPQVMWSELQEGQTYTGDVTRIEQYGAFVDIGAERPGLLHVREMSSGYVDHPTELVSLGDEIEVRILRVDRQRQRIDLTRQGFEEEVVEETVPEEETEEEELAPQTAMELAMERARADRGRGSEEKPRAKRRKADFSEREEILERTLSEHSDEEKEE